MNSELSKCCDEWAKACQSGTDNEMYGALVWGCDGKEVIGCGLEIVNLCPWCGARKNERKETEK